MPLLVSRSWLAAVVPLVLACCGAVLVLAPNMTAPAIGISGCFLALGISGSLVLHELAHALTARRVGVGVEHIRLFAGGASCRRLQLMRAPREQFVVAAAGLLASTALGVCALGVALGAEVLELDRAVALCLSLIGLTNILTAAANLLPVFPFDGGKLVHALLWRAERDERAASRELQRGGRGFSQAVAALGLALISWPGELLIGIAVFLFGVYLLHLPPPPVSL